MHPFNTANRMNLCKLNEINHLIYESRVSWVRRMLASEEDHPLKKYMKELPSGRRIAVPYCRTAQYRKSFLIQTIIDINY